MLLQHSRRYGGTFKSFALKLDVAPGTIYEWADKHPEFKEAKAKAENRQEHLMTCFGLKGMRGQFPVFHQAAWIFFMKCRFSGWNDAGPVDQQEDELEFNYS